MNKEGTQNKNNAALTPAMKFSSNSWTAKQRGHRERNEADDVLRHTRSICEGVIQETVSLIVPALVSCGMKTADHLSILIDALFYKATHPAPFQGYVDLLHARFLQGRLL